MRSATNWDEVVFGEIVDDSAFGPRFDGGLYDDTGNVATLRTTDISEDGRISYGTMPYARLDESHFEKHFLRPNDLVITRSGRIGTSAVFAGFEAPVLPGAFLIRFRLAPQAIPQFYCYYFNGPVGQQLLRSIARGAAQQNISGQNVMALRVPFPPLPAQRRIADILSAYDDAIENNRRRIKLLEDAARHLYEEWFVRLRFPGHEHVRIKNGVPEGWERVPFEDALVLQRGFDLPARLRKKGEIPIYASTGVTGWHNEAKVKGPGIVTGRSGSLGMVSYAPSDFWPLNTALWVREFRRVGPLFAYFMLQKMRLEQYNGGASVPTLDRNAVHRVNVTVPSRQLLGLFDEYAKPAFLQKTLLEAQNGKFAAARDHLLPKLMSGEIAA